MTDCRGKAKRLKTDHVACILCNKDAASFELVKPKDIGSWLSLYEAAKIRFFSPILNLFVEHSTEIPNVFYHRECRSTFTHKKELNRLKHLSYETAKDHSLAKQPVRQSLRQGASEPARIYDRLCIFCECRNKCLKHTSTRESLIQAVDLRADLTLRSIATHKGDTKILSITSRDIVAAEACYHTSCYKKYTKYSLKQSTQQADFKVVNDYTTAENNALQLLYKFIRINLFSNPRIVSLVELTSKLVELLHDDGVQDVRQSSKTHIRRNLESEFGDTLHFFAAGAANNVYVKPYNLSIESLARDFIDMKQKLETYTQSKTCEHLVDRVAILIRDKITEGIEEQSWPPNPQELTENYVQLPNCLNRFLEVLLAGSQCDISDKVRRLTYSFGQDIISAVTNSRILTPKHILLPWAVKTLTGNVELIKTLNRLGHGCSYTRLQEIDTAICMEKMSGEDVNKPTLPSWTNVCTPTVLAFDNIDRLEETLTGAGTSHRVNGIIVQPLSLSCSQERKSTVDRKDKRRTLDLPDKHFPIYISAKRENPPSLKVANINLPLSDAVELAKQKNYLWIITRLHDTVNQRVGSWTGFNIKTRDDVTVKPDKVGYLPTINAPATELTTVQEILTQSIAIQKDIGVDKIAVIMDQALYAKATEVAWKNKHKFENVLLMMGNFHVICNMLSIIGKLFRDAGLRDLAVESGVIAEGSIDKVLDGKQYNRGVRLHKLTYEALMRLVWSGFTEWLENNHRADLQHLNKTLQSVKTIYTDTSAATLESCINDVSCQRILNLFRGYMDSLRHDRGHMASFWMMYIDMVEILLGLIRADRSGDWYLHLANIKAMIPWCFAMDKTNYSRYLPVYYAQMSQLKDTCPDLYVHFLHGGFSVQLGQSNPFAKIPIDQTVEETVNKDTQTAGGTKGFSLKPNALTRFYMTAEHRAEALRRLRELTFISGQSREGFGHVDLQPSRIRRDEADVVSIVDMLEQNWTNPFSNQPLDLVCLSTGAAATQVITNDIMKAHCKGEDAFKSHMQKLESGAGFYEPIKKLKLKTFSALQKDTVIKAGVNKEVILKSDNRVFGQMLLIAQNRKLDMKEVFEYPLGPKPWALANADGTMKKTSKSALGQYFEKKMANVDFPSDNRTTVVDAMAIVQMVHGENLTFDELSDSILKKVLNDGRGSARIDVVFDVYKEQSIKTAERTQRGSQHGIVFSQIKAGHRIKNWKRILASVESKVKLTLFLAENWQEQHNRDKLGNNILMVTSGERCYRITKDDVAEIPELKSTHEEADSRMMLHVKHASESYHKVIVISEDTDVFVILLSLHTQIDCRILLRRGKKNTIRLIDISQLGTILGLDVCSALIGLHAYTGCDTTSSFAGQGKVKSVNLISKNKEFRDMFKVFGQEWHITEDMFKVIQAFTCNMYCSNTKIEDVNTLRYEMFRSRKGELSSGQLPPCMDALRQHAFRANYQAAIWKRSLLNLPEVPNPAAGHGWVVEDGHIEICWLTKAPAPVVVLELMSCKCSRRCDDECPCSKNGLRCTPACKLQDCINMQDEADDQFHNSDDDSDSDVN